VNQEGVSGSSHSAPFCVRFYCHIVIPRHQSSASAAIGIFISFSSNWGNEMLLAPWSCNHIWFTVNAIESNVCSLCLGFNSHSQTVMQCQPISASLRCSSLSRSLFLRIFATQKSWFVVGILQQTELSIVLESTRWPCQKHPLIKMQVRYLRNTKSGCPGRRLWFKRYLKPRFHNPRRTIISGFVFLLWIAAMFLCRCCGVRWSIV